MADLNSILDVLCPVVYGKSGSVSALSRNLSEGSYAGSANLLKLLSSLAFEPVVAPFLAVPSRLMPLDERHATFCEEIDCSQESLMALVSKWNTKVEVVRAEEGDFKSFLEFCFACVYFLKDDISHFKAAQVKGIQYGAHRAATDESVLQDEHQ